MLRRYPGAIVLSIVVCGMLGGCGNPYALKVNSIDYSRDPVVGSIKVTDVKLYRREALIDERRDEVTYLKGLLNDSKTQQFAPAVTRELQSIITLSASLGLSVDPAAGLNYRRTRETSDIQQEIATMKLQLQLDQLKRDAELMRAKLPDQTTPVNPDLGKVADGTPAPTSAATQSATLDRLVASVDALTAKLREGFGSNINSLTPVGAANTPFDTFNDRAAYRNLLNSALSAATLDELHDRDGAALVRVNLTATVLPPANKDYLATLGLLRMTVEAPDFNGDDYREVYRDWVTNLNSQMNVAKHDGASVTFSASPLALAMITRPDLVDVVRFEFGKAPKAHCAGVTDLARERPARKGKVKAAPADGAECQSLYFAVPKIATSESVGPAGPSLADILTMLRLQGYAGSLVGMRQKLLDNGAAALFGGSRCELSPDARATVTQAGVIPVAYQTAAVIERAALNILAGEGVTDPGYTPSGFSNDALDAAALRTDIEVAARKRGCPNPISADYVVVPATFTARLSEAHKRVAVYQVGPRNQAQTVSTVARAAEAISLAASIAGKIPSGGIGGDGNISYGRSATGKADALERVPLVIAFAEAATEAGSGTTAMPSFGWLMGPRTTLDARKKDLRLEQVLTTHDLTVDLSVPGWWPYLYLQPQTAWAPTWKQGNIIGSAGSGSQGRIRVALAPNGADFDNLTAFLLGTSSVRAPFITEVVPAGISACSTGVTLQIVGTDLWRADKVVIGGKLVEGGDISVLPDMRGIRVRLADSVFPAPDNNGASARISVLTPYGTATQNLNVQHADPYGRCKATTAPGG